RYPFRQYFISIFRYPYNMIFFVMYCMTPSCILCHIITPTWIVGYPFIIKLKADRLKAVVLNLAHGK
ncbi:MAG: hypothetical protein LBP74_03140, partial [Treponema sp.]|nr:hypothetical protein [Treponema sp.]